MKTTDIQTNPNNPRFIRDEKFRALVESIRTFPKMLNLRPIIIDDKNIIVGGNMRYKALCELGYTELEDAWVKRASEYTAEELREFIIKDNVPFGAWDWEKMKEDWDLVTLEEWGVDVPGFSDVPQSDEFQLPDGEKSPFQQLTFMMSAEQMALVREALDEIKETEEFKYVETYGNENSNANALYLLVSQWNAQKS